MPSSEPAATAGTSSADVEAVRAGTCGVSPGERTNASAPATSSATAIAAAAAALPIVLILSLLAGRVVRGPGFSRAPAAFGQ